jgi:hypothetical protein
MVVKWQLQKHRQSTPEQKTKPRKTKSQSVNMNESNSRNFYPIQGRRCISGALSSSDVPPLPYEADNRRISPRVSLEKPQSFDRSYTDSPDCVLSALVCDNWTNDECPKDESRLASDNYNPLEQEEPCKTHVILLRWSDAKGREAEYTGQVNELIQPHGLGCLVYKDGTAFTSIWSNGAPVGPSSSSYQAKPQIASSMHSQSFKLGGVARPQDMLIDPNPQRAHDRAASLHLNSFAFVLRSTGDWTYAIVSDGPNQRGPDASIKFIVDTKGRTKVIKARHWSQYIRLVNDAENQDFKKTANKKTDTKAKIMSSSSDNELARLTSFHRAVRRVSIDMSSRQYKNSDLGGSAMW